MWDDPKLDGQYITRAELKDYLSSELVEYIRPIKVFGLNASRPYAQEVVNHLKIKLTPHEERYFEDGECYLKAVDGEDGNVRGHDVFVIQSLYGDDQESVAEKCMKLCIFLGSLRSAGADKITAVIPHLAWARQDRKTESRAPITTKIIAAMLESVGIDRAMFMDVHNLSAEQNAFSLRTPIDNLESKNLHADWCAAHLQGKKKVVVMTPDSGGTQRATRFRNALGKRLKLDMEVAILDKVRIDNKLTGSGHRIIGDVKDAEVVIYDDMISTAGTMAKACKAVASYGGHVLAICATHGLFVGQANESLEQFDTNIVVADTVSPFRLSEANREKLHLVSTTKMMADAIRRIHSGTGSISELLR